MGMLEQGARGRSELHSAPSFLDLALGSTMSPGVGPQDGGQGAVLENR